MAKTDKEVFRIKPLEWRPSFGAKDEGCFAQTPFRASYYQVYRTIEGGWAWFLSTDPTNAYHPCASPEEGKQIAEQHWQEYIKQALVPVESQQ